MKADMELRVIVALRFHRVMLLSKRFINAVNTVRRSAWASSGRLEKLPSSGNTK